MGRKQRQPHYILSWHKVAGTYEAIKDVSTKVKNLTGYLPYTSQIHGKLYGDIQHSKYGSYVLISHLF